MSKPLCIDLFCGLGGWTEGFLAEGWDVIGFDIEQHVYGDHRYPAQLVLQDVRTLHGSQFKDADMIVASSPCQAYSYMAMPWKRAKQIARALRGHGDFPDGYDGYRTVAELNELFEQPARIQREAITAAGRFIPLIQENVRGAIPWVGRSQWRYGSYHLWGDVPALMPVTHKAHKVPGFRFDGSGKSFQTASVEGVKVGGFTWADFGKPGYKAQAFNGSAERGTKNTGGSWFNIGSPGQKVTNQNPVHGGRVNRPDHTQVIDPERGTKGYAARLGDSQICRRHGSKSSARKAASARIAKIPLPLAQYIARVFTTAPTEAVA